MWVAFVTQNGDRRDLRPLSHDVTDEQPLEFRVRDMVTQSPISESLRQRRRRLPPSVALSIGSG
jgi:hypothetical protein